MAILRKIRIFI